MPLGRLSLGLNKHKEREEGRLSALLVAVFLREKHFPHSVPVSLPPGRPCDSMAQLLRAAGTSAGRLLPDSTGSEG